MENRTITVTGYGEIHVVPDVTRIELSLNSLHDTYEDAYNQAKSNIDKISEIMTEVDLPQSQPKTIRLDIDKKTVAEYDKYKNHKGEKFLGFQLTNLIKIDLGMDNVVLNAIIRSIGLQLKHAEIRIAYTVKDARPAQLKMLEQAVKDAKLKAEIMASAAGCKLGECKSINYGFNELHIYSEARTIHGADEASSCTPGSLDITPDDLETSDEVDVVWTLLNA